MEIKVGMNFHDIRKRCWYQVKEIKRDMIWLVGNDGSHRYISRNLFEEIYKSSSLNKEERINEHI